jgi:hypothetical protein
MTNIKASANSNKQRAVQRILSVLSPRHVAKGSARLMFYGTAAAVIYAVAGGDPSLVIASPIIARLIESIGGNVIASLIDQVAQDNNETLSADEIRQRVEEIFTNIQPTDYLSEREFYHVLRIMDRRERDRHAELTNQHTKQESQLDSIHTLVQGLIEAVHQQYESSRATTAPPPAPPQHFTGRRYHLDILKAILCDDKTTAMIALQGMGGIGKTATVLQLAVEVTQYFPGGIFWGSLPDHVGDPRSILRTWGRACGQDLKDESDPNMLTNLVRGLLTVYREKNGALLVIIDDIRAEWLQAAKLLRRTLPVNTPFLTTTRDETLGVALDLSIHRLNILPTEEALTLLKAHAGAITVESDPEAALTLLERIDNLPLAIELAGKRLAVSVRKPGKHLSMLVKAIKEQPFRSLDFPGHPGLAATFAITYEALSSQAQRLFYCLGIFADGNLPLPGVAWVTGLSGIETETELDTLVSLALLDWGSLDRTYTQHLLLHQYARILLAESGEEDEIKQRYLDYNRSRAKAYIEDGPTQADQLVTLRNILVATSYAKELNKTGRNLESEIGGEEWEWLKQFFNTITLQIRREFLEYFQSKQIDVGADISIAVKLIISGYEIVKLLGNVLTEDHRQAILEEGRWIITVYRDPFTYANRDREVSSVVYQIRANTILKETILNQSSCFYSNDLDQLDSYQDEISDWRSHYNSILAVPIKYSHYISSTEYLGVLVVDSLNNKKLELYNDRECKYILEQATESITTFIAAMALLKFTE